MTFQFLLSHHKFCYLCPIAGLKLLFCDYGSIQRLVLLKFDAVSDKCICPLK